MPFTIFDSKQQNFMREFELSEQQVNLLKGVYWKRMKLLGGCTGALALGLLSLMLRGDFDSILDAVLTTLLIHGLFAILFFGYMIYLVFAKILPLRQDIRKRKGKYDDRVVINKISYPDVNKYFIFFNSSEHLDIEVSAQEYDLIRINDAYALPMGLHSEIVLDGNMNYNLL